jgi:hypothetical protein
MPKSGKPDFGWCLGRILRGPLRGHLRMTERSHAIVYAHLTAQQSRRNPFTILPGGGVILLI